MDDDLGRAAEGFGAEFGEALVELNSSQARAVTDMYDMVEAALNDDHRAADKIAATMRTPRLTAKLAAYWLAEYMRAKGMGPEVIDAARRDAGLRE
jgi:hypothetical protein